ncbi:Hypothetical protein Minf_0363 [Methylacidiphilum infernorum V4]|uniref:Uncharacterized protein n=1 Tax=Methylacidiphilum infernorum (isolate V4) TaxID=481448 RepID=B3DYP9_METI4|nr:Hypothetical protein Minf_0363 [Methylacidiphilum infernorum V4]
MGAINILRVGLAGIACFPAQRQGSRLFDRSKGCGKDPGGRKEPPLSTEGGAQ